MIEEGSKVKIHFLLKVDGEVVESSRDREPVTVELGSGELLPTVEERLKGLGEGASTHIELPPERAFGPRDPEAVRMFPHSAFENVEHLEVGNRILAETENSRFEASVAHIDDDGVLLDLNHPMAGKTLELDVEVVEVG